MFFLAFASSIRVFTLFLNLLDSEIIVIPFIVLCAIIFCISKKQNVRHFAKYLLIWLLWNILAIWVIFTHLNLKDSDYSKQFIWIKNIEYTTPERNIFNDFVRISDTQKYHKYYVETQDWKTYLLNSEKDYHIWDILYLSATEKDLDFSNIFSSTGNTIFSNEFWNYEFNYDKRSFMKWVDGSMYEKVSIKANCEDKGWILDCSRFTMEWKYPHFEPLGKIDRIRARMQNTVISIFWENKYSWLLLGLFIGDKSMIPSDNYDTFVDSWLVHIIAVSGGNIAMVLILLSFLLSFLPFYVRNGFLIVWIIFYALICGSDASVFRAAVMWSLTLIALFRGREISIRRSMMYAFMAILIFNPFSLWYDIGFILSFWAITWIVLFQKFSQNLVEKRKEKKKWNKKEKSDFFDCKFWKEYLVPTIWASLWTAPILIFFMNWVNLVGILLNIIIVPIIPIVTIYGFISLILSLIVQRSIRIRPEKLLMNIIYGLSEIWAKYAIFLQSDAIWKKYVLVVLFIWLWVFAYWKIYKRKASRTNQDTQDSSAKALEWQNKEKKNQIFDEIIDETP
jgi:ComEC/Rec2-related protein